MLLKRRRHQINKSNSGEYGENYGKNSRDLYTGRLGASLTHVGIKSEGQRWFTCFFNFFEHVTITIATSTNTSCTLSSLFPFLSLGHVYISIYKYGIRK